MKLFKLLPQGCAKKKTRTAMSLSTVAVPAEWITTVIFKDMQTRRC